MGYTPSKPPEKVQRLINKIAALSGHDIAITYLPAANGGGAVLHGQGIEGGVTPDPNHEGIEWVQVDVPPPLPSDPNPPYAWTWGVAIVGDPGDTPLDTAFRVHYTVSKRRHSAPKRGKTRRAGAKARRR